MPSLPRPLFRFRARNAAHDGGTFLLYTTMGLATTVIFRGFEVGFDRIFGTKAMRHTGGVIGPAIGYPAKCQLHTRYVFRTDAATRDDVEVVPSSARARPTKGAPR
jgi:hypothetical protein